MPLKFGYLVSFGDAAGVPAWCAGAAEAAVMPPVANATAASEANRVDRMYLPCLRSSRRAAGGAGREPPGFFTPSRMGARVAPDGFREDDRGVDDQVMPAVENQFARCGINNGDRVGG